MAWECEKDNDYFMRIIFITPKLNFKTSGGSVFEYDLLVRTIKELGHDIKVVTAYSDANIIEEPLPYEVIEEQLRARRLLGIQWGVFKLLKKYASQADFFYLDGHFFLYGAGLYRLAGGLVPVGAFFNRELIAWPEDISDLAGVAQKNYFTKAKEKLRWCIEKYLGMPLASHMDIFCFTNPYLEKAYLDFGLNKKSNSWLIMGDPFNFRTFMAEHGLTENSYIERNKKAGPITLFYSARMVPGRGFGTLLRAFAEIKNKDNFRLVLSGGGPEEAKIRKMIEDLNLEKYVQLPGWVPKDKLWDYFNQADIYVQARWRKEISSCTVLEAMTYGLPSILPGGGGLAWVAQDSALYFKAEDHKDLAQKIELLGSSRELRDQLSKNCYQRLAEDQMDHMIQTKRLCNEMLNVLKK
ncbi:MAG: glycosyltransferase [Patescibacteria group bacterium]